MSTLELSSQLAISAPGIVAPPVALGPSSGAFAAQERSAAALVHISGASAITVGDFEVSVPPNLAAASALVDQIAAAGMVSSAAFANLYTLIDAGSALALTS